METNLAVLIDFENIAAGTEKDGLGRFDIEAVLARLSDKGRVLIARSYADWGRFARFKQGLLAANVAMMELTSHGMQDKNRADIALVVEGMELAFTKPYIHTFVVVSGDSDFTPMVLKMRELDKRVIGVGCKSSTSRLLIQACDEFIFYDSLVKRSKSRRAPSDRGEPSLEGAFDLLIDTVEGLLREDPDPPHASVVKTAMLRKSPDFSETELGFSSFARFLERARKAGIVSPIRDEKSGGYRVELGGGSGGPVESSSDARAANQTAREEGPWLDPYLPDGTEGYVATLASLAMNPLAAPTRKAVLQALEENVQEREKRKRRVTVQFVLEDVRRRLRKSHPEVPAKAIRQVFNALMRANAFIHRDGSPVRTGSAPFTLKKTAEELNETIADIYVDELHRAGMMLDIPKLAELFFGDRSHTRPVEMSVAYVQAQAHDVPPEEDERPEPFLLDDGEDEERSRADADDLDALLVADGEPETEKKRRRTRKKAKTDDDVSTSPAPDAAVDEDAGADKKGRRRRGRKKKDESSGGSDADLDALLTEG